MWNLDSGMSSRTGQEARGQHCEVVGVARLCFSSVHDAGGKVPRWTTVGKQLKQEEGAYGHCYPGGGETLGALSMKVRSNAV